MTTAAACVMRLDFVRTVLAWLCLAALASPAAVAAPGRWALVIGNDAYAKVEPLRKLLDARTQLSNLLTYMDGKSGAEDLMTKVMQDPELLKSLAAAPKPAGDSETSTTQE